MKTALWIIALGLGIMLLLLLQTNRRIERSAQAQERFAAEVRRMVDELQKLQPVQAGTMTRTQVWTSGGQTRTWPVTQGENETDAEYDARCLAEWAEQLKLYPKDKKDK